MLIPKTRTTHIKQFLFRFVITFLDTLKRFCSLYEKIFALACFFSVGLISCGKSNTQPPVNPPDSTGTITINAAFAKGADISWITEMESKAINFITAIMAGRCLPRNER